MLLTPTERAGYSIGDAMSRSRGPARRCSRPATRIRRPKASQRSGHITTLHARLAPEEASRLRELLPYTMRLSLLAFLPRFDRGSAELRPRRG